MRPLADTFAKEYDFITGVSNLVVSDFQVPPLSRTQTISHLQGQASRTCFVERKAKSKTTPHHSEVSDTLLGVIRR